MVHGWVMSSENVWSRLTACFKKCFKTTSTDTTGAQVTDKDKQDPDKSIYFKIPLYRFHFMHEPNRTSSDGEYIGRDKIRDNLLSILNDGRGKSGTYLISGYRGSGKTSFVKTVLYDYQYGVFSYNKSSIVNSIFNWIKAKIGSLKVNWIKYYSLIKSFKKITVLFLMLGVVYYFRGNDWYIVVLLLVMLFVFLKVFFRLVNLVGLPLIGLLAFLMYCPPTF